MQHAVSLATRPADIVCFSGFRAEEGDSGVSTFVNPVVHFWRFVTRFSIALNLNRNKKQPKNQKTLIFK
jgi:hypothetical protein